MEIHSVQDAEKQDAILTFVFVSGGPSQYEKKTVRDASDGLFPFHPNVCGVNKTERPDKWPLRYYV